LTAVLPASGKNGDDTGWVIFKLPIAIDPGQIQGAVDNEALPETETSARSIAIG